MKNFITALSFFVIVLLFVSCKKEKDETTVDSKTCLCDSVTNDDSSITRQRLYYDNQKRLVHIDDYYDVEEGLTITYFNDHIITKTHYNDYYDSTYFDLDANGVIRSGRLNQYNTALARFEETDSIKYYYDSNNRNVAIVQNKFVKTFPSGMVTNFKDSLVKVYTSGNVTSTEYYVDGTIVSQSTLSYDLNKAAVPYPSIDGTPTKWAESVLFTKNSNLITEANTDGSDIDLFSYQWYADGNVSLMIDNYNGNDQEGYRYFYTCK